MQASRYAHHLLVSGLSMALLASCSTLVPSPRASQPSLLSTTVASTVFPLPTAVASASATSPLPSITAVASASATSPIPSPSPSNRASAALIPYVHFDDLGFPVAVSPDGRYLAVYGRTDAAVELVEILTDKVVWSFPIPDEDLANSGGLVGENAIAFSPDGKQLAFGGNERIIYLLDAHTGKLLKKQGHSDRIATLAFVQGDRKIIVGSCSDQTGRGLTVWDSAADTVTHWPTIICGGEMLVFPDKPLLITPDLTPINYDTGITTTSVLPGQDGVHIALSPDGHLLAAVVLDVSQGWSTPTGKFELWDFASNAQVAWPALEGFQTDIIAMTWSSRDILATLSSKGMVSAWDMETRQKVGSAQLAGARYIAFSPDGSLLIAGHGATAQIWEMPGR